LRPKHVAALSNKSVVQQTGVKFYTDGSQSAGWIRSIDDDPWVASACRYRLALLRSRMYGNTKHTKHTVGLSSYFMITHRKVWTGRSSRNLHTASFNCKTV